jgi:hypothetical protein
MRNHTIRSAAKGGNGLASAPLQLSKYDDDDSPSRDAVFGEISDEGPDYRSVSKSVQGEKRGTHQVNDFSRSDSLGQRA